MLRTVGPPEVIPPGKIWCDECHQFLNTKYIVSHRRTLKHKGNVGTAEVPATIAQPSLIPTLIAGRPKENIPVEGENVHRPRSTMENNTLAPVPEPYSRTIDTYQPMECAICMDNKVECVLVNCGHMCLCMQCANGQKFQNNGCPICREPIAMVVKVFPQ